MSEISGNGGLITIPVRAVLPLFQPGMANGKKRNGFNSGKGECAAIFHSNIKWLRYWNGGPIYRENSFPLFPIAEVRRADGGELKRMWAWYAGSGENKGDYKLPHHKADGYRTVWRGVAAAMGALLGARGGVDLPGSDRRGVYNHLAKHYAQFDKEPPAFKGHGPVDLALIVLGIDPGLSGDRLFKAEGPR